MLSLTARIESIIFGLVVLMIVSFLVRRRRLYNVYAITWFLVSLSFILMGAVPYIVEAVAQLLGIYFTPAAILVIAIGGILGILLHLSIIVTDQNKQIRRFEKEIALLREQLPSQ
jgi:hypothetical protein